MSTVQLEAIVEEETKTIETVEEETKIEAVKEETKIEAVEEETTIETVKEETKNIEVQPNEEENNYMVVAFAMDMTGENVVDEMFSFAACDLKQTFRRYIMCYRGIGLGSMKKYRINIVPSTHRPRREMIHVDKKHLIMESVTEYSALVSFIKWLTVKKRETGVDGIILAYYDDDVEVERVTTPTPILMKSIERYGLSDRFFNLVKGFVNVSTVTSGHPKFSNVQSLTFDKLVEICPGIDAKNRITKSNDVEMGKVSQDPKKENSIQNSAESRTSLANTEATSTGGKDQQSNCPPTKFGCHLAYSRAYYTYEILRMVSHDEVNSIGADTDVSRLLKYITTKEEELEKLKEHSVALKRFQSLGKIFFTQGHMPKDEVILGSRFRRSLVEAGLDYNMLKAQYQSGSPIAENVVIQEPGKAEVMVQKIMNHFQRCGTRRKVVSGCGIEVNVNDVGAGDCKTTDSEGDYQSANESPHDNDPNESEIQVQDDNVL